MCSWHIALDARVQNVVGGKEYCADHPSISAKRHFELTRVFSLGRSQDVRFAIGLTSVGFTVFGSGSQRLIVRAKLQS